MHAYIDESGDPGTYGKGSRWLVFGCVMVAESDVARVDSGVQAVRNRANPQSGKHLHFRDLSHDDKVGALNLIAEMPWTGIVVASDTTRTQVTDPQLFYDFTAVHVVQRVLDYAGELGESANIYFESSGYLHLEEFESLVQITLTRGQAETGAQAIMPYDIQGITKGGAHGLDIADGLAYAVFRALEPNRKWGHFEPAYLNILTPRLWKSPSSNALEGWGLTLAPTELAGHFREEYPWLP